MDVYPERTIQSRRLKRMLNYRLTLSSVGLIHFDVLTRL